jgi:deoxycytidine triphosphate deaminase
MIKMILAHSKILAIVKDPDKKLIENFSESCLEGAGYDLRVGKIYKLKSGGKIGVSDRRTPEISEADCTNYILEPDEYVLIETIEKVNMPENLLARILNRSSLFRCGCSLFTAVVDPGYRGALTIGLKNLSAFPLEIEIGAKIGQVVFETVDGETKLYSGKYQGGKVV